jgi:HD-like signal output (HDOD) protein
LIATLTREDVSFGDISGLIERDTVLSGQVLRLVNSAAYARRATVGSVRHAVALLGILRLRNVMLGFSITRMWNRVKTPSDWSMQRFNEHAAATAIMADLLAQRVRVPYGEGAFVAGLLHDMGRLVIATGLPQEHDTIQRRIALGGDALDCERDVLGVSHQQLSADTLERWNIPAPIRAAVLEHHAERPDSELAPLVRAADRFANLSGVSIYPREPEEGAEALTPVLGSEDPQPLMSEFRREYEAIRSCF